MRVELEDLEVQRLDPASRRSGPGATAKCNAGAGRIAITQEDLEAAEMFKKSQLAAKGIEKLIPAERRFRSGIETNPGSTLVRRWPGDARGARDTDPRALASGR